MTIARLVSYKKNEAGATSLTVVIVIFAIIAVVGTALLMFADAEILQSQIHRAKNDVFFVADSGRRVAERCFQDYMLGSVKQNLPNTEASEETMEALVTSQKTLLLLDFGGLGTFPVDASGNLIGSSDIAQRTYLVDMKSSATTARLVLVDNSSTQKTWNPIGESGDGREFYARISVFPNGVPYKDQCYSFPLRFEIEVEATAPLAKGKVARYTTYGRGTVTLFVNNRNFTDYLEFTDSYYSNVSGEVCMNARDQYYGPVHTSGTFHFAGMPGTLFQNVVTTTQNEALFWTGSSWGSSNKEYYPPSAKNQNQYIVWPQFQKGYFWGVPMDPLSYEGGFLFFQSRVKGSSFPPNDLGLSTRNIYMDVGGSTINGGGIWAVGPCAIGLQIDGHKQRYYITHYASSGEVIGDSEVVVDYDNMVTSVRRRGETVFTNYTGLPDVDPEGSGSQMGIYVDGSLQGLYGIDAINAPWLPEPQKHHIADTTELTILSKNDIIITGDLRYENAGTSGTSNILGIISENGKIVVDYPSPPQDIYIDANIFADKGEFGCADCNGVKKGYVYLFGSIATKNAGKFGTDTTGYGRYFTWDTRAAVNPPPNYPNVQPCSIFFERPDNGNSTWRVLWSQYTMED
jgi:hypothetical protein